MPTKEEKKTLLLVDIFAKLPDNNPPPKIHMVYINPPHEVYEILRVIFKRMHWLFMVCAYYL